MASLASLLASHSHLSLTPQNKIHCSITGHDMPPRADIVQQYLSSTALRRAREWGTFDYTIYLPYIVPHKGDQKKLFCTLTKEVLHKIPEKIKNHVNGKRFIRLKAEADEIQKKKMKNTTSKETAKVPEADSDSEIDFWMPDDGDDGDNEEGVQVDDVASVDEDVGNTLLENSSEYSDEEFIVRKVSKKKRFMKKLLGTQEVQNDAKILLRSERIHKVTEHKKSSKTKVLSEKAEKGGKDSKKRKTSS